MNIAFPIVGGSSVVITSGLALFLATYYHDNDKPVHENVYVFYRCMAGYMLGAAVCTHYTVYDWLFAVLFLSTFAGIHVVDYLGRMWNKNPNMALISDDIMPETDLMHQNLIERTITTITPETSRQDLTMHHMIDKDNRRRLWFFGLQVVAMTFLTVAVPLKKEQNVGTIFCFVFATACSTLALCGGMFHVYWNEKKWIWLLMTLLWTAVVAAGQCVPFIVLPAPWVLPIGGVFLGIPAAALLYLHNYYGYVKKEGIKRGTIIWGLIGYCIAIAQAPLTKYFIYEL